MTPLLPLAAALALAGLAPGGASAAPSNDACEDAKVVPEEDLNRYLDFPIDLPTATAAPDEPAGCAKAVDRSVWYRWTAPADGLLLVVTGCTPDFPALANVYTGSCESPSLSDCGEGACAGGVQLATAFVAQDEEYLVQLGTDPFTTPGVMAAQLCFLGPEQEDADDDGIPDCIDACTDDDRDGFGDGPLAKRPLETCPADNCEDVYNADQADRDGDGIGDACDEDEDRCQLTLQEAVDANLVLLSGKGCYTGDCLSITVLNPGPEGCVVKVRRGDVVVSRDESEQDMGVTRDQDLYVPPGGQVTLNGIYAACLELEKGTPIGGRIFDVTDNLADAVGHESLEALLAVLQVERGDSSGGLQGAVWRLTNGTPEDPLSDAVLTAAGLDPAKLPSGGFPALLNPFEGETDPEARHLEGLLTAAPAACVDAKTPDAAASCLLDELAATTQGIAVEAVKKRLRKQILKRVGGVRTKLDAAIVEDDPKKLAKLRKAASTRAEALLRLLERSAAKDKLPAPEASALQEDAADLAEVLALQ